MNEHEPDHDQESNDDFTESAPGEQELPFGMSGISDLLDRLADGVELGEWSPRKCRMVAEYVLTLADGYWLSQNEAAYCRRLVAAA
ncbi:MAG: hypothetical protein VX672_06650 [Planctomycetota bacterium]|nr:hypothetical protein [Planctomycetota bacterium]